MATSAKAKAFGELYPAYYIVNRSRKRFEKALEQLQKIKKPSPLTEQAITQLRHTLGIIATYEAMENENYKRVQKELQETYEDGM